MAEKKPLIHLGIIMDGNGRWAKAQGKPRTFGHREGAKALQRAAEAFQKLGGKYLTVFAFSTENWNRPKEEVDEIMRILTVHLRRSLKQVMERNIRIKILGDTKQLSGRLQKEIREIEEKSKNNTAGYFNIALNYGGRLDILNSVKKIAYEVKENNKSISEISFDDISNGLYTAGMPDPDMIVRTSGENRISNFLLWQMAYSEFYFVPYHWPEFDEEKMKDIFEEYSKRNRRYGAIKEDDQ